MSTKLAQYVGISFFVFLLACTSQETYQIPEAPAFDEEYYAYALASVDEIIQDDPDNAEAYYRRAELLLQQNKTNNALASIRKAIEINSDMPLYHLANSRALLQKGQNREAVRAAKVAQSKGAPLVEVYDILAEASMKSNYYEDAILYSDSASSYAPKNSRNYYRKGKAQVMLEDTLAAEKNLLKSLELGEDAVEVYGVLVDFHMNTGNYERAKSFMDEMLTQPGAKTDSRMLLQQAKILLRTGYEDSARAVLYRLKQVPSVNNIAVFRELQELHYQNRIFDSSLYYAQQILDRQPSDKQSMITVARIHDRRRNYSSAIRQYEAILELDSLQQQSIHQIARQELDDLRGKVAYLWKKKQEEEFQRMKQGVPAIKSLAPEEPNP
uniref:Tetratricopeptide repeat protein n=1 Tax=Roseihalotalea indica TaxID=2867963 RepID=A0AA49GMH4_9BACT|nr:tetratricopeptide repeat protein [Tunicatimonas sp. TK19036]